METIRASLRQAILVEIFENRKQHLDVMMQSNVTEIPAHFRDVLMKEFEDMVEAIQNSDSREKLQRKAREMFQDITAEANGSCNDSKNNTSTGKRQSMKAPFTKRRKTHGTDHMQHNFLPAKS